MILQTMMVMIMMIMLKRNMMMMMMMFIAVITINFTNLNLYNHNYHHCKIKFSRRTEKKKTNIYCLFTMIAPTFKKSSENYQTIKSNLPEKNWRLSFQGPKKNSQTKKNQPGDLEDGQIVHRNFGKKKLCLLKAIFWWKEKDVHCRERSRPP